MSTAVLKKLVGSLYSGTGLGASCFCPLCTFAVVTGQLGPPEKQPRVILRQEGLTAAQCAGTTADTSPTCTSPSSLKSQSCDCLVGVSSSSLTHDLEIAVVCAQTGKSPRKGQKYFSAFLRVRTNPGKEGLR